MSSEPNRQPSPYSQSSESPADQFPIESLPSSGTTQRSPTAQTGAVASEAAAGATGALPWAPSPAVDLIENTDELWVFIDLPGFQPDEIQLQGDARTLRVSASRPSEVEEGRNVLMHERTIQVERTIQLPVAVDLDEIDAIFEHGVCKLTIPKAANERYRDIEIRTRQ